jgi:hypothetical protein
MTWRAIDYLYRPALLARTAGQQQAAQTKHG